MKIGKGSSLFSALSSPDDGRIIPYIEKWLVTSPHAGIYKVDDRPYQTKNPDRATMNFHPSSDCLKCERLLYFERDVNTPAFDDAVDARLQAIFKTGSAMHAMIQSWFAAMSGMPGFPELVENEQRIEGGCFEGYGVGGYIDSVLRLPGVDGEIPVELKTSNDRSFSLLNGPSMAHRMQIACYIAWKEAPFGIVLYINKNTCEMREFRVEPLDLTNVLTRWSNVRRAVLDGSPKGLPYGCKPGSKEWERCPASHLCFRG